MDRKFSRLPHVGARLQFDSMAAPRLPTLPAAPDVDDSEMDDAMETAPRRLHADRRPAQNRKHLRVALNIRERGQLRRLQDDYDMPLSAIVRLAIRSLYESVHGPIVNIVPNGDSAA